MKSKLRGELMLLLAALIWGASFVAQRTGMEYVGPFTFNGIRSLLGSLALVPVILVMNRQQKRSSSVDPTQNEAEKRNLLIGGGLCGLVLFVASSLQQYGMVYTTAGKAGFITALYIVLVPLCGLFLGKKIRPLLWLCVALATVGLYLLSVQEGLAINKGDLLVLASAFGFTVHILVIDHFSPKTDGVKMSCLQFLVCGLLSLPFMLIFETIDWANIAACWLPIAYAGILSCGVAYTLQIIAQKRTEPTIASLLLSLESAFALLAGMLILQEQISLREAIGCLIMFAAIMLAQLPEKRGLPTAAEEITPNHSAKI
ncbi:MAG: DMT family transporter [Firmicutes bacterium]|nr:DMT family transporter [Bacillota bacterium]